MAKLLVVGASAGGLHVLQQLVSALPSDLALPIAVVQHIGTYISALPHILRRSTSLKVLYPNDGDELQNGTVFIAPPDRHLLIVDGRVELSHGPRENWSRPSIDPLFRSAAESYGKHCVGLILSGTLNDGTAGLYEIKRRGGLAIVQDPGEAQFNSMPRSAIDNVDVDWVLPLKDIPPLLVRLAAEEGAREPGSDKPEEQPMSHEQDRLTHPVAYTCPECGGAMFAEELGKLTRFQCHVGHAMTDQVLAVAQQEKVENAIDTALRAMNERTAFCGDRAEKAMRAGDAETADTWRAAEQEAKEAAAALLQLSEKQWLHPEPRNE